MEDKPKTEILKQAALFRGLGEEDIARLAELGAERALKSGDFVFWEGDPSDNFYVVIRGRVKILKQSSGGKDFIIAFFGPGELFGEAAAFQGRPYPASAQAAADSLVLAIKKQDFLRFLASRPEVALAIINLLAGRLREAQSRLKDLAGERVEQRIASVLTMLVSKLGPTLPFTRQEIADMTGTTTETAIRVIGQLKKRGILATERGKIVVTNETKLRLLGEGPPIIPDQPR